MRARNLLLLGVLAASACKGATDSPPAPSGYLGAQVSGALTTHYEADGRYPGPATAPATFAAARRGVAPGTFAVGGWRARGTAGQDALLLDLEDVTGPGVYAADGIFTLGAGGAGNAPARSFRLVSAQVTLTRTTGERLQGTFSATGVEMVPPLGPAPDTVLLSSGLFDVPVVLP